MFVEFYDTANFGGHTSTETRRSLSLYLVDTNATSEGAWGEAERSGVGRGGVRGGGFVEPFKWRFSPQTMSVRISADMTPVFATATGEEGGEAAALSVYLLY